MSGKTDRLSEYTDRELLDWIIAYLGQHQHFLPDSVRSRPGPMREAISCAMRAAGIEPGQRETVTMKELLKVASKAFGPTAHWAGEPLEVVIRAVLRAATAADGSLKKVEE